MEEHDGWMSARSVRNDKRTHERYIAVRNTDSFFVDCLLLWTRLCCLRAGRHMESNGQRTYSNKPRFTLKTYHCRFE
jgi:hypothetical protein